MFWVFFFLFWLAFEQSCSRRERLVLFLPKTGRNTRRRTRAVAAGFDCVRMISTISAKCDVAFCALAVIIADFTDLHTTLPFPTPLLLLTYSRFPLFIRASPPPPPAPSIPSPIDARREKGKTERERELPHRSWNSQSDNQSDRQSRGRTSPFYVFVSCMGPKWRLHFIFFHFFFVIIPLVQHALNTIALNMGSHAAPPACVCNP